MWLSLGLGILLYRAERYGGSPVPPKTVLSFSPSTNTTKFCYYQWNENASTLNASVKRVSPSDTSILARVCGCKLEPTNNVGG